MKWQLVTHKLVGLCEETVRTTWVLEETCTAEQNNDELEAGFSNYFLDVKLNEQGEIAAKPQASAKEKFLKQNNMFNSPVLSRGGGVH